MKQKRTASLKSSRAVGKPRRLVAVRNDETAVTSVDEPQTVGADAVAQEVLFAAAAAPAHDACAVLTLAENCILRDAGALKEQLLKLQDLDASVTIQVGAVQRIETANLQVLSAFVRDRIKTGRQVQWSGESRALSQAINLLGLNALLGFASGSAA
jgi:anti-anti-sigma regulatory factor